MASVPRRASRGDDRLRRQVAGGLRQAHLRIGLGDVWHAGIGIGVDRNRAQAQPAAGGEDPPGDLAAVGHQNVADAHVIVLFAQALIGGVHYIRKTPKFDVPSTGPLAMADKHIPNTVRVSRGSITPSS